jgi:hypothetical protein
LVDDLKRRFHQTHLQENTGNQWNMKAVFLTESPETSGREYCFHVPLISGVFLQQPAGTS